MKSAAQEKTDPWLENLLQTNAPPLLKKILEQPERYKYQLIYTQINRDKKNRPSFRNYYLHVNGHEYFNPASMVKMPVAFLALEKINELNVAGLDKHTPMFTDSSYSRQTRVKADTTSATGLPSIAHYIRKIFIVSDNDAYNRLYEFLGQEYLNKKLWQKGYPHTRITRRFVSMNEEQNRHTNAIRFEKNGELVYLQPAAYNTTPFDFSKRILVGNSHYNREDSLIRTPMDFTTHNNFPLQDIQQILQSFLFPESVSKKKRFQLTDDDRNFLLRSMSELPFESAYPRYDTTEFFDSYTKFFLFKAGRSKIPGNIRVFNKTGWSYGFLTDVAYIVDYKNGVEFMLSGNIYVNEDGVLNDNKYEYEEIGYPFFKEVGNLIYQYELERTRKYRPDLKAFNVHGYPLN